MNLHGLDQTGGLQGDHIRKPQDASEAQGRGAADRTTPDATPRRADRVEISDAARALASQSVTPSDAAREAGASDDAATLSGERVAEIVNRLESGFYDQPETQSTVAQNLLSDLGTLGG